MTQVFEAVGNLLGQWAFSAWLAGPGVVQYQNDFASFFWDPVAGLSMGLRRGDPAPQMPQGIVLSSVASYLGDAGRLAYVVSLAGLGVNDANDTALYATNASGAVVLLATEGGPAPGTEPGTVFSDFQVMSNSVVVNAFGQVGFAGGLVGTAITPANEYGIWVSDPATGALALRVRQGDPAPELPGLTLSELWAPILNNRGDLVFKSMLEGPGAASGTNMGIFALERGITPVKVVRAGDLVSFGPGDMRALRSFSMLDGRISDAPGIGQLTDNGQIVFIARTWTADAIVVATLPKPRLAQSLVVGASQYAGCADGEIRLRLLPPYGVCRTGKPKGRIPPSLIAQIEDQDTRRRPAPRDRSDGGDRHRPERGEAGSDSPTSWPDRQRRS